MKDPSSEPTHRIAIHHPRSSPPPSFAKSLANTLMTSSENCIIGRVADTHITNTTNTGSINFFFSNVSQSTYAVKESHPKYIQNPANRGINQRANIISTSPAKWNRRDKNFAPAGISPLSSLAADFSIFSPASRNSLWQKVCRMAKRNIAAAKTLNGSNLARANIVSKRFSEALG